MNAKTFVDSNVLLYLLSDDAVKASRVETLLAKGPIVSVQVLNEFAAVSRRKMKLSWAEIRRALAPIKLACFIVPITAETHDQALDIAERSKINIYDALIIAAASMADCNTVLSEDLNAGQRFGKVMIQDPFA